MEMASAFNFSCAAILDFMASLHCPVVSNKRALPFQQQSQCSDVMKSKMAVGGKFKSRNLFHLLLFNLLIVTFPLSSKICNLGIIWSNLASTHFMAFEEALVFIRARNVCVSRQLHCILGDWPLKRNKRSKLFFHFKYMLFCCHSPPVERASKILPV